MKIVSAKPIRVTTLHGAIILFEPGEPKEVADEIGLLAIQMGAAEVGREPISKAEETVVEEAEVEEFEQDLEVIAAMNTLISEADPKSFKNDGTPKAAVINKMLGRTVRADEREAAWEVAMNT